MALRSAGRVVELLDFGRAEGAVENGDFIEQASQAVLAGTAAAEGLQREAHHGRDGLHERAIDIQRRAGGTAHQGELEPGAGRGHVTKGIVSHSELGEPYLARGGPLFKL